MKYINIWSKQSRTQSTVKTKSNKNYDRKIIDQVNEHKVWSKHSRRTAPKQSRTQSKSPRSNFRFLKIQISDTPKFRFLTHQIEKGKYSKNKSRQVKTKMFNLFY